MRRGGCGGGGGEGGVGIDLSLALEEIVCPNDIGVKDTKYFVCLGSSSKPLSDLFVSGIESIKREREPWELLSLSLSLSPHDSIAFAAAAAVLT